MYGVDSKDSVPADFPKKNSGLAPEGLSILAGTGAGHRPLWCPTMALKIKIPGGSKGAPPWRFFPRSYSISLGQMRKHLRGPGQATYDFDGVRPGLLVVKKGGGHQARPEKDGYGGLSAHKERNPTQKRYRLRGHFLLSEFQLVATKGSKNAAGSFVPGLTGNAEPPLTHRSPFFRTPSR